MGGNSGVRLTSLTIVAAVVTAIGIRVAASDAGWSDDRVCRAGIAAVLMDSPRKVAATSSRRSVIYLAYTRESDKTVWRFKCLVDGDRILWGSVFAGSEGRWRTETGDGRVHFEISDDTIIIRQTHPDGSQSVDKYRRSQL